MRGMLSRALEQTPMLSKLLRRHRGVHGPGTSWPRLRAGSLAHFYCATGAKEKTSLAEWMAQKKFKLYIYNKNGLPKKFKVHELRK